MVLRVPRGQIQPQNTLPRTIVTRIVIRDRKNPAGICPPLEANSVDEENQGIEVKEEPDRITECIISLRLCLDKEKKE